MQSRRLTPFDIEAHRGGRSLRPENTLPSFANALSMGVDTLELDMGVTRDGAVVVSHERGLSPDLARTPPASLRKFGSRPSWARSTTDEGRGSASTLTSQLRHFQPAAL